VLGVALLAVERLDARRAEVAVVLDEQPRRLL